MLIKVLTVKFNCKCSIHKQRGFPVIYITARSMKHLRLLLLHYFPKSMTNKLIKFGT
jgi:hypothetical protein